MRVLFVLALVFVPALCDLYFVGQHHSSFVRKLQPQRSFFRFDAVNLNSVVTVGDKMQDDTDTETDIEADTDTGIEADTDTDTEVLDPTPSASVSGTGSSSPSASPSSSTTPSESATQTKSRTASRSVTPSPSPSLSYVNPGNVNECATNNGGCSDHATCRDIGDTVECRCKQRFEGDGRSCTPQPNLEGSLDCPGTLNDYNDDKRKAVCDGIAQQSRVNTDDVSCDFSEKNSKATSVLVTFEIFLPSSANYTLTLAEISSQLQNVTELVAAINEALEAQGLVAIDPSQVVVVVNPSPSPSASPSASASASASASPSASPSVSASALLGTKEKSSSNDLTGGEIAAAVIMSVFGALVIFGVAAYFVKKHHKATKQEYQQTFAATSQTDKTGAQTKKYDALDNPRM